MLYYKRISSGKPPVHWTIVDENGNIINRNPNKNELKDLEKFSEKHGKSKPKYTNEQLLYYLVQFYEKYGRPPTRRDFTNNSEYPSYETYRIRFGSWSDALKLVGLDIESMVKKGVLLTNQQKARLAEMIVRDHFEKYSVDLAGENYHSHCDGICPNGKNYDVKGSGLRKEYNTYSFSTRNKYKEEIEIYYFLAFNEDYTKLDYGLRIPGEIVEGNTFILGLGFGYEFNIENTIEYNITYILREVFDKYEFFNKDLVINIED